jgi:putative spermidine/putrescine transport system substrate-binding protein
MRLKALFGGLSVAIGCLVSSSVWAEGELTVVSWGGALQEAERKAWFEPVAQELGITVKEDTVNGIADVRAQVQSGSVTWDLVELGSNSCVKLAEEGNVEKLDLSMIDTGNIDPGFVNDYWVGNLVFSTVLAWNTKTYGDKQPETWADMWDVETFPGGRSMYRKPYYNLEAALMAAGVDPKNLYPLDVDLAFEQLEKIRPHVVTWWPSGAASAQLIRDGEVDMLNIWNGRVQAAIADGAEANLTFNQQLLDFDCMVIPKGAPNKELAMKVLAKFLTAEYQARLPLHINYGPVNAKAFESKEITPEMAAALPSSPENAAKAALFDPIWWSANMDELQQRFDLFVQE